MAQTTLGVIVGNRDFFPDVLVGEARRDLLALFRELDIEPVLLDEHATKGGSVETWAHARQCADLFRAHRDRISGVVVSLPNFGDEKGVADTLKLAELNVPVLVQAYPDDLSQLSVERRRDAFCGKISVCNNLRQYGIPFSLTPSHVVRVTSDEFRRALRDFAAQAAAGPRRARIGAVGARPNAFNTTIQRGRCRGRHMSRRWICRTSSAAPEVGRRRCAVKERIAQITGYDTKLLPGWSMLKRASWPSLMTDGRARSAGDGNSVLDSCSSTTASTSARR